MQESFMSQFEAFFCQHGYRVGQVRAVHCLAALDAAVSGIFFIMESAAPSVTTSMLNLLTQPTRRLRPFATCQQNRQCKRQYRRGNRQAVIQGRFLL